MLKALPNNCEEAAMGVGDGYIPCNKPATRIILSRSGKEKNRMCDHCADHNVRNRGATDIGPFIPTPMANKSSEIKLALEQMFPGTITQVKIGRCPSCKKDIDPSTFRDSLSRREYGISGLCQECQDEVFGK